MTGLNPALDPAVPPAGTSARPAPRARLVGVDAARGLALLGMMAVHALYSYDAAGRPTAVFSLAAGRAAAVFAVLAGVGIAFLTGRRRLQPGRAAAGPAAALVARGLVIGAIGLALGHTDAEIATVILPYYAVLFVLAVPLVFLSTRALVAAGAAIAIVMPVLSQFVRAFLPESTEANHSFGYLFSQPLDLLVELTVTGEYPALTWAAYLCFGIAVGRLRLSSAKVAAALLGVGSAVAVAALALSDWMLAGGVLGRLRAAGTGIADVPVEDFLAFGGDGVTPTTTWWWLAVRAPHTGTPFDLLHTTGTALALLGALLLLGHVAAPALRRVIDAVLVPLAAAGSMTLTLYTAHVVFMNSPLDVFDPVPGYLMQVAAALLFALFWRRAVGRGPLESLASWAAGRARKAVGPAPTEVSHGDNTDQAKILR